MFKNFIKGIIVGSFFLAGTAFALSIFQPTQGGSGTSQIPILGQVLVGTSAGVYTPQATSTLGLASLGGNNTFTGTNSFTKTLSLNGWTNNGNGTTTSLAITGLTGMLKGNDATAPISVAVGGVDYPGLGTTNVFTGGNTFQTATATELCFSNGLCMNTPSVEGSNITMYPWNFTTDIATYEGFRTVPDTLGEVDESCSASAGYCAAPLDNYVSTTSLSATGSLVLNKIPAGTWSFDVYTYVNTGSGSSVLEFTMYRRSSLGVETQLFQATTSAITNTTVALQSLNSAQQGFTFNPTDRLVMRVKGYNPLGPARTIHWVYENGAHYSHVTTPITIASEAVAFLPADNAFTGQNTFSGSTTMQSQVNMFTASTTWFSAATSTINDLYLGAGSIVKPSFHGPTLGDGISFSPTYLRFSTSGLRRFDIVDSGLEVVNLPLAITGIGTLRVDGTGNSSFAGKLGIATTTPWAKLSVAGLSTDDPTLPIFIVSTSTPSSTSTSLVVNNRGFVGVGLANPTTVFHIADPASAARFLKFDPTVTAPSITGGGGLGLFTTGNSTIGFDGTLRFTNSFAGSVWATFTATGLLSIGTTTATSKLEIGGPAGTGNVRINPFTDGKTYIQTYSSSVSNGQDLVFGSRNSDWMTMKGDTGNFGIASTGPYATLVATNITNSPSFIVEDQSFDPSPFIIDASGNVGIGTTTTSARILTIDDSKNSEAMTMLSNGNGGAAAESSIYSSNDGTTAGATWMEAVGTGFTTLGAYTQDAGILGTGTGLSGGLSIMTRASAPIRFYTGSYLAANERMRITETGNVGIGTTSPLSKLAVSGGASIGANYNIAAPTNGLIVEGSVGVGTNSPLGKLSVRTVSGDGNVVYIDRYGDDTSAGNFVFSKTRGTYAAPAIVQSGDSNFDISGYGYDGATIRRNAEIAFSIDGTPGSSDMPGRITFSTTPDGSATVAERMRIDNVGNVGIASTTPYKKFSVNGTGAWTGLTTNTGAATASLCLGADNEITKNTDAETCIASSIRYKKNVETLSDAKGLSEILKLTPVSFNYKDPAVPEQRLGFIAETVAKIDPRLVAFDDKGIPNGIRWSHITTLLVNSVQEIIAKITGLEERMTKDEARIQKLEAQIKLLVDKK